MPTSVTAFSSRGHIVGFVLQRLRDGGVDALLFEASASAWIASWNGITPMNSATGHTQSSASMMLCAMASGATCVLNDGDLWSHRVEIRGGLVPANLAFAAAYRDPVGRGLRSFDGRGSCLEVRLGRLLCSAHRKPAFCTRGACKGSSGSR
jgi:hypothetical protein